MNENTVERLSIDRELGEIQATLIGFRESQSKHNDKIEAKLEAMDERLRKVEHRAVVTATVISTVGAVGSFFFQSIFGHKS